MSFYLCFRNKMRTCLKSFAFFRTLCALLFTNFLQFSHKKSFLVDWMYKYIIIMKNRIGSNKILTFNVYTYKISKISYIINKIIFIAHLYCIKNGLILPVFQFAWATLINTINQTIFPWIQSTGITCKHKYKNVQIAYIDDYMLFSLSPVYNLVKYIYMYIQSFTVNTVFNPHRIRFPRNHWNGYRNIVFTNPKHTVKYIAIGESYIYIYI